MSIVRSLISYNYAAIIHVLYNLLQEYNDLVKRELLSERQQVNFLTADGVKFAHPLHHLGKSKEDLPLIAIDSFRNSSTPATINPPVFFSCLSELVSNFLFAVLGTGTFFFCSPVLSFPPLLFVSSLADPDPWNPYHFPGSGSV